ncbi:Uncharacterised protein [Corynebacterium kutscheri]|uniref:Uncharacterized protein n=1 Tax=Corynebacterium kutscheri TaxID=35755 RepID=A0A0F6R0U8_9CORY|nr:hypothetical protein [Corynebacterium kutscheri]AKE41505.1 hypothetical protein UL82_06700 [Corynebacterium kutscheri]VEH08783.1 Uncharacterised protein [Corynebacterium kutscheri]VEH09829.1 Uncharacterised protein [Corynebacterium kutscheri]VEH79912.1 Uncharacterised protein [Corynebacterium kutscheri]
MPSICFDVLIHPAHVLLLQKRFDALSSLLIRDHKVIDVRLNDEENPPVPLVVEEQLRELYRRDHGDNAVNVLGMHRFLLTLVQPNVSVNELAMTYSRLLTPQAVIPNDVVALMQEEAFEIPATYPWVVEIWR